MPIIQQLDISKYKYPDKDTPLDKVSRLFPRDNFNHDLIKRYIQILQPNSLRHYFLKVPLLGQHNIQAKAICKAKNSKYHAVWCGRTSASMIFNYYQLLQGGDPEKKYITHWKGSDNKKVLDLRFAESGDLAFQTTEKDDNEWPMSGCAPLYLTKDHRAYLNRHTDNKIVVPDFKEDKILPVDTQKTRIKQGEEIIAGGEKKVQSSLDPLVKSLQKNNPILIYTGISDSDQHVIVINGVFYLRDQSNQETMWFMICDPAPAKTSAFNVCKDPAKISNEHEMIVIDRGGWDETLGALYLLRANVFFKKKADSSVLWMDSETHGGRHYRSDADTPAFKETVEVKGFQTKFSSIFSMPFSTIGSVDSPIKYYYNNECATSGIGGYYAMGLQRNLHGGIHLFPDQFTKAVQKDGEGDSFKESSDSTAVRCMAPGYIVAARFPEKNNSAFSMELISEINNWAGFVLIRHVIKDAAEKDGAERNLYSLYMHLASPDYTNIYKDQYYGNVPWIHQFFQRQYGCFIKIAAPSGKTDELKASVGTVVWALKPVDQKNPGNGPHDVDGGNIKQITIKDANGVAQWYFKAPLADYTSLVNDLKAGNTITFSEPFFSVMNGDIIGYAKAVPGLKDRKKITFTMNTDKSKKTENGKSSETTVSQFVKSGFIHWEILCPADNNSTISWLVEKANALVSADSKFFTDVKESKGEENFLDVEEIKGTSEGTLRSALSKDEQSLFDTEWKEVEPKLKKNPFGYAPFVIELLNDGTMFAPQTEKDWNSGKTFTYPVKIKIDSTNLPKPSDNDILKTSGMPYEFKLQFKKRKGETFEIIDAETPVTIDDSNWNATSIDLTLQVPADIDAITLIPGEGIVVTQDTQQKDSTDNSLDLFSTVAKCRWRNAKIEHINEWSNTGIEKLYNRLKKEKVFEDAYDVAKILPFAWWKDSQVSDYVRLLLGKSGGTETKAHGGNKQSLFGAEKNMLPLDAKLHNLHPVTAVWMLRLLAEKQKIQVVTGFDAKAFGKQDNAPFAWGWARDAKNNLLKLGDTIHIVVIDDDYSYDQSIKVTVDIVNVATNARISFGSFSYSSAGVVVVNVIVKFWGEWVVEINKNRKSPNVLEGLVSTIKIANIEFVTHTLLCGMFPQVVNRIFQPFKRKDGIYQWAIPLKKGTEIPQVNGWIKINTALNNEPWKTEIEKWAVKAISITTKKGSKADAIKRDNLIINEEFITGLSDNGLTKWMKEKKCPVTDTIDFNQVLQASDNYLIACSLVNAVQTMRTAYKKGLKITSVAPDGLSCVVRNYSNPTEKTNQAIIDKKPATTVLFETKKHVNKSGKEDGVAIIISKERCETVDQCTLLKNIDKLKLSPDKKMITGASIDGKISESFDVSDYNMNLSVFVNTFLADALHQLKLKVKNLILLSISNDGCSCCVAGKDADVVANELNLFSSVTMMDGGVALTIDPARSFAITVSFRPEKALLNILSEQNAKKYLGFNDRLRFRFMFAIVNGGEYVLPLDAEDMNGGVNPIDGLNKIPANTILQYEWSNDAGSMVANNFGKHTLSYVNSNGKTVLRIVVPLFGDPLYWKSHKPICKVTPENGKEMKIAGLALSGKNDCIFDIILDSKYGKSKLTIEVIPLKNESIVPRPITFQHDFTQKFISDKLTVSVYRDGCDYLRITANVQGVAIPPSADKPWAFSGKKAIPGGSATKFKLTVTPDPEVIALHVKKNGLVKLSTLFEFALPADSCSGYSDSNGIVDLRIKKILLPERHNLNFDIEMVTEPKSKIKNSIQGTFADKTANQ
jgi:hypothetical protein